MPIGTDRKSGILPLHTLIVCLTVLGCFWLAKDSITVRHLGQTENQRIFQDFERNLDSFRGEIRSEFSEWEESLEPKISREILESLKNPEILDPPLDAAIDRYIARQEERGQQSGPPKPENVKSDVPALLDGPSLDVADPDDPANLVLVEFYDYRCPYCRQALEPVKVFLEGDPNITFVLRDLPILGPESQELGKISLAAARLDEEKFFGLHSAMMTGPQAPTAEQALQMAEAAGYNPEEVKTASQSPEVQQGLDLSLDLAQRIGLPSTPAFALFHPETGVYRGFSGITPPDAMQRYADGLRQEVVDFRNGNSGNSAE